MHNYTKLIEIKLDFKNRQKKDFIKFLSTFISKSCVFYKHGSGYIRKVSFLGTGPKTVGMGTLVLLMTSV